MYCPYCGTLNDPKPSFCRKCGQRLTSVQLALDGRVDEVQEKFKKVEDLLAGGLLTFAIFVLAGIISFLIGGGPIPVALNIILGLVICTPIVITGLRRVDRLRRLLAPDKGEGKLSLEQPAPPVADLPAARPTDPLDSKFDVPVSVTEHTTFRLKTPEPNR